MLDVRRLRLLRELALRGTLAGVAAALNQSPSSVSQQLAQLEAEVGVELLRKSGRRVQLTAQAEILVGHTAAVLERLELAESELADSLSQATGVVRIAVFQSAALALMPAALSLLAAEHPRLRVEMTQREPETALYETWARDYDLVIAEQYPGHTAPRLPELDRLNLTTDALRLAVPGLDGDLRAITSLQAAAEAAWVMEPRGAASRHWAEQACRQAGFEPDVRFETADLQAQMRLIESGNAVALMPDLVWTDRGTTARLIDLPGAPHRTVFTSVRRASAARPGIIACREVLARIAAAQPAPPR
ncbi:LysR family transcriptional regulator [Subtercola boreus]|uniref:LysR family transcriptional regulator n=1 Tax=Subtercola boreus TaxID=120213 RepID=A0A3E0W9S5_9MICO|nr:LysR family transcriptional regulator [Subtercola boreus]RFA19125.1 LysR family transcriptional regulator [Subtercola boreus]RFA19244.1 LysR family transcriptional regulator [Subtercola boreus]RFA25724.1 LysR family transcriptional regulator [Subtercola boreus]